MRVIDGSTRHDAHAELNTRPGRCCVVVHGAQYLSGLSWTLLIPLECVRDAGVEFQAAGVVGNPWWFQRQRLAVGGCAGVSSGGRVPALGACGVARSRNRSSSTGKGSTRVEFFSAATSTTV